MPQLGVGGISSFSWLMGALVAEAYAEAIPRCSRGRILDLGCGTAPLYPLYKSAAEQIILADWPHSLHLSPCLDCYLDLSRGLPFHDQTFDLIILSDVLEHLASPEQALSEVRRVATHGARILLNVPFLYGIHEAPHDYYRYTEHGLDHLARQAGLKVESIRPLGGGREVITDIAAKLMQGIPGMKWPLLWLQRLVFLVRRRFNVSAQAFPLGYFVELARHELQQL